MKKNSMKLIKHDIPQFSAELYMCIWSFKDVQDFGKLITWEEIDKQEYEDCLGVCIASKRKMVCAIITDNCPKNEQTRVLLHETVHGIHYLFDFLWINMSYDNSEDLAYYVDYYYTEIVKFLKQTKKKKTKKTIPQKNKKKH